MPSKSIPRGSRSPAESATIQYFCKIFTHDGIIVVVKVLSILFDPDRETSHYKWCVSIFSSRSESDALQDHTDAWKYSLTYDAVSDLVAIPFPRRSEIQDR